MPSSAAQLREAVANLARDSLKRTGLIKFREPRTNLRIAYVPAFVSKEELADQYYRMVWYMHPLADDIESISMAHDPEKGLDLEIPAYMDPAIKTLEQRVVQRLRFFPDDAQHWREEISRADILMQWRTDFSHSDSSLELLMKDALRAKKSWRVDRHRVRYEGSFYLKLSHDANRDFDRDLSDSRRKLDDLAQTLGGRQKGYVFGTGPSLAEALDLDFSDGVNVICNSIVRNKALLRHLDPKIIAIADPIFHAGCSSYAGEFRRHLCETLDTYDAFLVVPFRDYKVYMSNLPGQFGDRIIGVPLEHISEVNLDLKKRFVVKSTQNVLTLLLLPVACTFFREIGIVGCDGKKLEENDYFWQHHKESQLNEQMQDVRAAHPAFFDMDYTDYYLTHCNVLEEWLSEGEKKGIVFKSLTHSYIPALNRRSVQT